MEITKNFEKFVASIEDMNYHEVYELYQAASGNDESVTLYSVEPANGSADTLIIHIASNNALRLTPQAKDYFPTWIKSNLMGGLEADIYDGMKYNEERDKEREAKGKE